jgi:O-antigen ligase
MLTIIFLVMGSLAILLLAVAGLFRPFLGLLVFLAIHFVQPGELIPALAPFRIELVYGALLVFAVLRRADSRTFSLRSDRILLAALLLIGVAVLSVPFAVWPGGAAQTVIDMVKLVAITFLLKLLIDSEARLRNILWCMAGVAAWFAGSSLFAFIHGGFYTLKYDWGTLDRAQGINSLVGGPNELAGLLLALLPLLIVLLRTTQGILPHILVIGVGGLSLAAISLTGSRIAIIALIAMGLYYTFQSKYKLLTCAVCLLIAILIWGNLPVEYKQRYLTVQSYAEGGELDGSNEVRLQIWRAGRQIFSQYPIVGVGAGQFANAYGMIYLEGRSGDWMNPHNLLIQVACELGLIGLAAFSYFLWQIAKGIRVALREQGNAAAQLSYQVGVACSVMYVGIVVISAVSHTLYRPYWYLLAALVTANRGILYSRVKSPTETAQPQVKHAYSRHSHRVDAHIGHPAFHTSHPPLPVWRIARQQSTFDPRPATHNLEDHRRDARDPLASETPFPAQYWTSGSNSKKRGDQG